ncbi:thyroid receptor-interacting protein 6-like [Acyrthosiphon pisum]|uniref:Zyxin n=1 Tax=Acyrthosiphon pisum TaxID=7029 RepID=A0A8R2F773_ACYPI|nr:thyroid receptor-interacting protein 6-like [Acyrthosiphon pisum]|eukprot:XP_008181864.2 PREDICTED: thyroid receptor-interacting protein 6-like [Acyrthosiphon pisum]
MSKKPPNPRPNPLYANVFGVKSKREESTTQNEPTYYNTVTNRRPQSSRGIYSNVNYRERSNNIYSNIAETGEPTYANTQYPLYDNVNPSGRDNIHSRPSSVSSCYSELQNTVGYEYGAKDFDNSSSQASKMYESIYEHIDAVRPVSLTSELSSTYSMSSFSQPITTREHETDVDSLTDLLVNSMYVNDGKKRLDSNASSLGWNCTKCNRKVTEERLGCRAMGNVYHIKCFTCTHCGDQLKGKSFYLIDNKPYCEEGYLDTIKKCSVCQLPIFDRILRATGRSYHPHCFRCIVCSTLLDGVTFTIDAANQVYCIDDFHKKFAPKCSACKLPIKPEVGQDETIRFVALDRSFHVKCYRCEDCDTLLGSEAEGRGCYPLDDHVLCKSCNAKRVQALTSTMITDLK